MSELASRTLTRTRLPFTTRRGDTVTIAAGCIHLNGRPMVPVDALELSAALARAVHENVHLNHTTLTEGA
ncbi:hypothetical protein ACH4T9_12390 [Micromonospora sp. NPDC020750]|uniref:hypothetical protein n=1 Tax=unclassified Micromonospora TaxID=2617518 RepID=UPI0037AEF888